MKYTEPKIEIKAFDTVIATDASTPTSLGGTTGYGSLSANSTTDVDFMAYN